VQPRVNRATDPVERAGSSAGATSDASAPDTGSWRLGVGGIRLTDATAPQAFTSAEDPDADGKRAAGNRAKEISVQDLLRRSRDQDES
jgi:hypothetical protein